MIRVAAQPEPSDFADKVRRPGEVFLVATPQPSTAEWKSHSYWTRSIPDLYKAYRGICNFSCHWIPPDTGSKTIEHFKPKSKHPKLAYEWSNFRLMCGTLNGRKKDFEDVLDPFVINDDAFIIQFPSLLVKSYPGLPPTDEKSAEDTIKRLRLNDAGTCLQARHDWLRPYCEGEVNFDFLQRHAPFLARELKRQKLKTVIKTMMSYAASAKT